MENTNLFLGPPFFSAAAAVGGRPSAGAHSRAGAGLCVAHPRCSAVLLFLRREYVHINPVTSTSTATSSFSTCTSPLPSTCTSPLPSSPPARTLLHLHHISSTFTCTCTSHPRRTSLQLLLLYLIPVDVLVPVPLLRSTSSSSSIFTVLVPVLLPATSTSTSTCNRTSMYIDCCTVSIDSSTSTSCQ